MGGALCRKLPLKRRSSRCVWPFWEEKRVERRAVSQAAEGTRGACEEGLRVPISLFCFPVWPYDVWA